MIYDNPCVYIFYLHLTITDYFSFAAGLLSACRTASDDNTLWPVEHNLINEYGLGWEAFHLFACVVIFLCRSGQIWTHRSLFMGSYCITLPVHDEMCIGTAKHWSMTVRLPSLRIKQVIENAILHAQEHLLHVVRNMIRNLCNCQDNASLSICMLYTCSPISMYALHL